MAGDPRYYVVMINNRMTPVEIITKRFYIYNEDQDEYASGRRYVTFKYLEVTDNKTLLMTKGKMPVSQFNKTSARITKQEYEEKTLTLRSLYGSDRIVEYHEWET